MTISKCFCAVYRPESNGLFRGVRTACTRAPFPPEPLTTATALSLFPRFGRFTTSCDEPKASEAGRFSADMIVGSRRYQSKRWWGARRVFAVEMWLLALFEAVIVFWLRAKSSTCAAAGRSQPAAYNQNINQRPCAMLGQNTTDTCSTLIASS